MKRFLYRFSYLTIAIVSLSLGINFYLAKVSHVGQASTATYYSVSGQPMVAIQGNAHSLKEWRQRLLIAYHGYERQNPTPAHPANG